MHHHHWIEINADALVHNLQAMRRQVDARVKILAVVKADAYGLGLVPAARIWQAEQVDMLGVTNLAEGLTLRREGITLPILLFAPLLPEEAPWAVEYALTPTVNSWAAVRALDAALPAGQTLSCHLKVDTGLGRLGLKSEQVLPFCRQIKEDFPRLIIAGIYSHLAQAGRNSASAEAQLRRFHEVTATLAAAGLAVPLRHLANSLAALEMPAAHLDMVRLGTVLYGQRPAGAPVAVPLENPWQAKAQVLQIQSLPAGASVGYGGDYRVKQATRIAIIPCGYADGLGLSPIARPKNLSDLLKTLVKTVLAYGGRGPAALQASYREQKFPFVGRLGMQLSMLEIGDFPLKEGDIVNVPLGRIAANPQLPRIYRQEAGQKPMRTRG